MFKEAELSILDIINNIPTNLDELEIARYLYISLGKTLGYDINILPDKNIWGLIFKCFAIDFLIYRLIKKFRNGQHRKDLKVLPFAHRHKLLLHRHFLSLRTYHRFEAPLRKFHPF